MKFFSKIKKTKKKSFKPKLGVGERALRDWRFVLIGFATLLLLVVVCDGYIFFRINQGDFFAPNDAVVVSDTTHARKTLLDANNFFDERQKEYDAFTSSNPSEIDPSI